PVSPSASYTKGRNLNSLGRNPRSSDPWTPIQPRRGGRLRRVRSSITRSTFKEELAALWRKHGIELNPAYLLDGGAAPSGLGGIGPLVTWGWAPQANQIAPLRGIQGAAFENPLCTDILELASSCPEMARIHVFAGVVLEDLRVPVAS